jgi:hypothetical protein
MSEGSTTAMGNRFDIPSEGDFEPMQSTTHLFYSNLGLPDDSNWLDCKVLRREVTTIRDKESLSHRVERAGDEAQNFLRDLTRKAEKRHEMERKLVEARRLQEENLKRQAEEYREKLRGYLRPELRD